MSVDLRIEFDWLERETGSVLDRAFAASIGMAVGGEYLTRLEDLGAKTVRNQLLASAWRLAAWFAANWWRLRWEPAPSEWWKDADWRMAHCMAAAGGGYVWPNAVFASDGDSMAIAAKPRSKSPPFEPIRYINNIQARITMAEFEQKVDAFMDGILSRMQSLRVQDESLAGLWAEIVRERNDAELSQQRKLEAMAGFDPDKAPSELLEALLNDRENLGKCALAEVAAEARHATASAFEEIRELSRSRAKPRTGGFRVHLPRLPESAVLDDTARPWQNATRLAGIARTAWGFGKEPIRNEAFADLLKTQSAIFLSNSTPAASMSLGIRTGINGTIDIYFHRPSMTTRRFAASRLLGDFLFLRNRERLHPATHAKTARQKFQRAFAQEFLCPIDALLEKMQTTQPDEDDISEAAAYFEVSPLMVRTTLVNHGQLEREALTWGD